MVAPVPVGHFRLDSSSEEMTVPVMPRKAHFRRKAPKSRKATNIRKAPTIYKSHYSSNTVVKSQDVKVPDVKASTFGKQEDKVGGSYLSVISKGRSKIASSGRPVVKPSVLRTEPEDRYQLSPSLESSEDGRDQKETDESGSRESANSRGSKFDDEEVRTDVPSNSEAPKSDWSLRSEASDVTRLAAGRKTEDPISKVESTPDSDLVTRSEASDVTSVESGKKTEEPISKVESTPPASSTSSNMYQLENRNSGSKESSKSVESGLSHRHMIDMTGQVRSYEEDNSSQESDSPPPTSATVQKSTVAPIGKGGFLALKRFREKLNTKTGDVGVVSKEEQQVVADAKTEIVEDTNVAETKEAPSVETNEEDDETKTSTSVYTNDVSRSGFTTQGDETYTSVSTNDMETEYTEESASLALTEVAESVKKNVRFSTNVEEIKVPEASETLAPSDANLPSLVDSESQSQDDEIEQEQKEKTTKVGKKRNPFKWMRRQRRNKKDQPKITVKKDQPKITVKVFEPTLNTTVEGKNEAPANTTDSEVETSKAVAESEVAPTAEEDSKEESTTESGTTWGIGALFGMGSQPEETSEVVAPKEASQEEIKESEPTLPSSIGALFGMGSQPEKASEVVAPNEASQEEIKESEPTLPSSKEQEKTDLKSTGQVEGFELIAGCTTSGKKAILIAKAKHEVQKPKKRRVLSGILRRSSKDEKEGKAMHKVNLPPMDAIDEEAPVQESNENVEPTEESKDSMLSWILPPVCGGVAHTAPSVNSQSANIDSLAQELPSHYKIKGKDWKTIYEASATLANVYKESPDVEQYADEDLDHALSMIQKHAARLGLQERELMELVQNDERSVKSGLVTDDGTITEDSYTASYTAGTTASYRTKGTHLTSDSELRQNHPMTMKLVELFDYYFVPKEAANL